MSTSTVIERTNLGASGVEVPRVSLGTMTFGQQVDAAEAERILDRCLDAGIEHVDTANMYNAGESERIIGGWLAKDASRRDKIILASKVRYAVGDDERSMGLSRWNIMRQLEASLERLGTDHLDIYYLHAPDYRTHIMETLHAMDAAVRDGKVRAVGFSNYSAWQMAEGIGLCRERGWARPTVVQSMYNLIARDIEVEQLAMVKRYGLGLCTYNPLAAGLLSGKHRFEAVPGEGRFKLIGRYVERYWHQAHFDAVGALAKVAEDAGRSLLNLAFRWTLDNPRVATMILGVSSLAQLEQNLEALGEAGGAALPAEVHERCDAIYQALRGFPPAINR